MTENLLTVVQDLCFYSVVWWLDEWCPPALYSTNCGRIGAAKYSIKLAVVTRAAVGCWMLWWHVLRLAWWGAVVARAPVGCGVLWWWHVLWLRVKCYGDICCGWGWSAVVTCAVVEGEVLWWHVLWLRVMCCGDSCCGWGTDVLWWHLLRLMVMYCGDMCCGWGWCAVVTNAAVGSVFIDKNVRFSRPFLLQFNI